MKDPIPGKLDYGSRVWIFTVRNTTGTNVLGGKVRKNAGYSLETVSDFRVRKASGLFPVVLFCLLSAGQAAAQKVLFHADSFAPAAGEKLPSGWTTVSRMEQFRPTFAVDETPNLGGPGSLRISGGASEAASGCWRTEIKGISPEKYYRLEASLFTRGVPWTQRQAMARLYWLNSEGGRAAMPEFVPESGVEGDWRKVSAVYRPPKNAVAVRIELFLGNCAQGTVWWDDIKLSEVPEPPARMVKVAAADCRPDRAATNMDMAAQYLPVIEQAGQAGCDILLLGETITLLARADIPTFEKAEPIPGPITDFLGEYARKHGMYIIVGLLENENGVLYNTAAIIDRRGEIAGKYRKVFLPLEDLEIGVTPGDHYPVFDTDFGRIGIIICYDIQFTAPAQAMAVQGAEVIFCPNWGNVFPVEARAIENQVYIVSSGFDVPTDIFGPDGKLIDRSENRPGLAVAEIDLNRPLRESGQARRRHYMLRELRPDIIVPGFDR